MNTPRATSSQPLLTGATGPPAASTAAAPCPMPAALLDSLAPAHGLTPTALSREEPVAASGRLHTQPVLVKRSPARAPASAPDRVFSLASLPRRRIICLTTPPRAVWRRDDDGNRCWRESPCRTCSHAP